MYDFDHVIDRRGTGSRKWDIAAERGYPADVLPMWVADMDFEVLPEISQALRDRVMDHRIYGYSAPVEGQHASVCDWMARRHGWRPREEWIVNTPGVVAAVKMAIQCFTEPGDAVIIHEPLYYPFRKGITDNGRRLVGSPLRRVGTHYEIDFEDFERKITENDVKLFILCSPHNPVGKVYTADELRRLGQICKARGVLVVCDEIHGDFVYGGQRFVPYLSACPENEADTVLCTGASKTFNLAGLKFSNIFIPDAEKRERFVRQLDRCGIAASNALGGIAAKAAYENGDRWVDELLGYLEGNIAFFRSYLAEKLPELTVMDPEGLYLIWVDVSAWGLSDEELTHFMIYEAKVWLDEGYLFGEYGHGYERFNLACPRSVVKECVDRIADAAHRCGLTGGAGK